MFILTDMNWKLFTEMTGSIAVAMATTAVLARKNLQGKWPPISPVRNEKRRLVGVFFFAGFPD